MLLDIGAGIALDGAMDVPAALEALSLSVPQAASENIAATAKPAPAMRTVFTRITPFGVSCLCTGFVAGSAPDWVQLAVNEIPCQPVAPSGTVPARSWVWV
ncbi:hypothetical protein GCM10022380_28290 [Amycolatopsis tucumanensis]|uniref:Uncharacterized protein n=1 Tax=Amycolatopsis tucumanensis TaxID=401106 RepID=A0ABP7I441_9PSEU